MYRMHEENRLFTLARSARRLPHILVVLPIGVLFLYGALIGGAIIGNLALGPFSNGAPLLSETIFEIKNMISFGLVLLLLMLWLRWFEGRRLWTLGLERQPLARPLLVGWLVSVAIIAAVVGLSALLGGATVALNTTSLGGLTALALSLLIVPSRFVQSGAEEVLFRGWMLPVLGVRYRPWMGVLVSSFVFSVLHVANAGFLPLAILNITLLGLFMALYALRQGSLWGVIALHAGLNWAQANFFGLPASGHTVGATFLHVHLTGSELFTGGAFGIENSLSMTIVALIAVVVEIALARRAKGVTLDVQPASL
jgi:uncharacterized protein